MKLRLLSNKNGSAAQPSQQSTPLTSSLTVRGIHNLVNDLSIQLKLGFIAIIILVIFFSDLYTLGSEALTSDYYNYVIIIPFMMAYLVYRKRRVLSAILPLRDDGGRGNLNLVIGICGLFAALMVYLYGIYSTDILSYHLLGLEIFLASAILLLFNRQTLRTLAVPILLINAALPAATDFGLNFWYTISLYSILPAYLFLKLVGLNVTFLNSQYAPTIQLIGPATGPGGFQFAVGVASSGVYSFVGFTVFALFVAYISKGQIWKKVSLFLIGYALLIPINTLREIILITAANYWGIAAFNFFHATSGIVLITIVTFLLLVIGDRLFHLDFFGPLKSKASCVYCHLQSSKNVGGFCSNCGKFLKSARSTLSLKDSIAIEAMIIIFLLFFVSLAPAYANAKSPSAVDVTSNITPQQALTFLPNIHGYNLTYQYRDTTAQDEIGADAILMYSYTAPNGSSFLASVQVLTAYHTPDTSIVQHITNYGLTPWTVYANNNVQIPVNQSATPLTGGFIAFLNPQQSPAFPESIMWWNLQALFNFSSYSDYRTVQIWLIYVSQNSSQVVSAQKFFLPIASEIASWWEPKLAYSLIQTTIRQSSLPLAGVAMIPAVFVVGNDAARKARAKRSNRNDAVILKSVQERKLLEALESLNLYSYFKTHGGASGRGTLEDILARYSSTTGQSLDATEATIGMAYLEHLGFVERKVIDVEDEPVQVWQSLVPKMNTILSKDAFAIEKQFNPPNRA